jgi:hypothetical protein
MKAPTEEPVNPSYDYVNSILRYDPETGILTWRERPREHFATVGVWKRWNTRYSGTEAGALREDRNTFYRKINIDGRFYKAHRLAYLLFWGVWPKKDIDHVDGDGLNNRWDNLRDVSHEENHRNARKKSNNTSGVNGVCWHKARKKWHTRIQVDGRNVCLGYFHTLEEAAAARLAANEQYNYTKRHGVAS